MNHFLAELIALLIGMFDRDAKGIVIRHCAAIPRWNPHYQPHAEQEDRYYVEIELNYPANEAGEAAYEHIRSMEHMLEYLKGIGVTEEKIKERGPYIQQYCHMFDDPNEEDSGAPTNPAYIDGCFSVEREWYEED
ncbi:hypothetical protein [Ktedonobacter racemifer]|uniref:Uncharacterized protein n=1 Tax=Ktedonobacter racemifer DSM 44963 TaxID=485913 RepID=D6U8Q7_KTERA|nr:hypothetical protein [Ktedonobacter racemifer]EFH79617.1 hypothetical protein Krac_0095 [Ktedonobacter racemifer DSM 44963]